MAFQNSMVEDQINKAVRVADQDTLLPSLETESVAELEQEFLQLVQKLVFEMRFAHHLPRLQAEEFEDIWIADRQTGLRRLGAGVGKRGQLRLVMRQAGTLEVE